MELIFKILSVSIFFIIALYTLSGARHGFLCSCANTGSVALSWLIAGSLSPILTTRLYGSSFFTFVQYMTEVSDNVSNIELGKTAVSALTQDQFAQLSNYANLPPIYSKFFLSNVNSQIFADKGLTTVSQYLNETLACVSMSIICFIIVYAIARMIFMISISTWNHVSPFMSLRQFDHTIGGLIGVIRAFLVLFTIMMVIPILLMLVSGTKVEGMIENSPLLGFFYTNTPLYYFITGT